MTVPPWVQDTVFYQIFPDRFRNGDPMLSPSVVQPWGSTPRRGSIFGGDLCGVLEGLDHVQDVGATALYLTPVFQAPSNHKYDTSDYYRVDNHFGDQHTFRQLVDTAHSRGMRVVLDGVFNHCGSEHPFFQDVLARGSSSPYWDWFAVRGKEVIQNPEPNYDCWAGVRTMPEWNHDNPDVRSYLLGVARHWIRECDIDGWRLDTVEYLPPDFVRELRQAVKETKDAAYILGEVMGVATSWFKHRAVDGVMHYKLREALQGFAAEDRLDGPAFAGFVRAMWRSYPTENGHACYTLLSSHDKPRFLTLSGGDGRRLRLAAALLFGLPGAPAIYYGDEVGLEGEGDPDCRRCFPWNEAEWDKETLGLFKRLVALRRREPVLRRGSLTPGDCKGRVASFVRELEGCRAVVVGNAGGAVTTASLPGSGPWRDALEGDTLHTSEITLPPWGFRILLQGGGTA